MSTSCNRPNNGEKWSTGSHVIHRYASFVAQMHTWVLALLALGAAIDVAIAAAMVGFLLTMRERNPVRTARVVDRLIVFTLHTGLITRCVPRLSIPIPTKCTKF